MKIFISYRREDTAAPAGRISDRLAAHFGRTSVFIDVDSIPIGVDFRQHLAGAVEKCDALLVVIGGQWAGNVARGNGRLHDPADFVRIEIEAALARDIRVIPVLIDRTALPRAEDLPPSIQPLVYRNACHVDSGQDFHLHLDRLIRGLEQFERHSEPQPEASLPTAKVPPEAPRFSPPAADRPQGFTVEIASGHAQGTVFELNKERVVVGRAPTCDIWLDFSLPSRHHAQFVRTADGYSLEDLESRNGTFLNGDRVVGRVPLKDGDRIHIGDVILLCRRPE